MVVLPSNTQPQPNIDQSEIYTGHIIRSNPVFALINSGIQGLFQTEYRSQYCQLCLISIIRQVLR